jgi:hypothetical protein
MLEICVHVARMPACCSCVEHNDTHIVSLRTAFIQGDSKVAQLALKYLLVVALQYSSTRLGNTQHRSGYATGHAYDVMLSPVPVSPSAVFKRSSTSLSFSQVQRVLTAEHCLASRCYLTYQNVFRDTFPDPPA